MFYDGIADIEVDPQEQTLYYVSGDRRHLAISRIKIDGTADETVMSGIKPRSIALWSPDPGAARSQDLERRIFWVDDESAWSANLDGSDAEVILTGLSDPAGIAIDQQAGILIWSESSSGHVKRARIDGTDIRTIVSTNSRISGIAVASSPSAATLIYPPSLATGLPTSFDLTWDVPPVNARSDVQVAAGSNMTDIVFALNTPKTTAWFDAPIADSDYYWRARAVAAGGVGSWTPWSKFSVGSEGALAARPSEPADGATEVPVEPTLTWQAAASAVFYHLQVSDTTVFDEPIIDADSLSETTYTLGPLDNETTYFWRVAGVAENGAFTFSQPSSFTTMIEAPAAVSLVSPEHEESGVSAYPEFSWNPVGNSQSYTLEVALDSVFSHIVVAVDLAATTHAADVALAYDTRYFWHVRASNTGGSGSWSDVWAFRTAVGTRVASDGVPVEFKLHQSYPNPFNPVTTIRYDLPSSGPVTLFICNALGQRVATLVDKVESAGRHEVVFDAGGEPSGLYLYRLTAGAFEQTRMMSVAR